jgi:hypothetical protein
VQSHPTGISCGVHGTQHEISFRIAKITAYGTVYGGTVTVCIAAHTRIVFFSKRHVLEKRLTKCQDRKNTEPSQHTLARGGSALAACGDPSRLGNDATNNPIV